jgi:tripartite-type tricarboxylate transporter receptor subunit TctC
VVGGHVDLVAVSLPAAVAAIKQGQLRGLGVASQHRAPSVPDVPTYAEAGFPDFHAASWVGFFVPAKTNDAVVAKLNGEINAILKEPDVLERLKAVGFDAMAKTQAETVAYFKSEVDTWGKMARSVGVSTD